MYYIILMDQSVFKLFFIIFIFYGLSLVIVYGKYNPLCKTNCLMVGLVSMSKKPSLKRG